MNIRLPFAVIAAFTVALVMPSAGCSREKTTPAAETQTQTPVRSDNQPVTVIGCLRAGEAAGTFVLTSGGPGAATYNLMGVERGVNLHDHTGKQVEVNGVVVSQQQTASRAATPADDKATGTAGTPAVETRTTVDIRQIEVDSIRRTGGDCK